VTPLIAGTSGIYYFCGLSVVTWAYSFLQGLTAVFVLLVGLAWDLLKPARDPLAELPHVHQALFNVTRDATRVADLLAEFLQQVSLLPEQYVQDHVYAGVAEFRPPL
jgi:hypothetical protein